MWKMDYREDVFSTPRMGQKFTNWLFLYISEEKQTKNVTFELLFREFLNR